MWSFKLKKIEKPNVIYVMLNVANKCICNVEYDAMCKSYNKLLLKKRNIKPRIRFSRPISFFKFLVKYRAKKNFTY